MKNSVFGKLTIALVAAALCAVAVFNYLEDPFVYFHKPYFGNHIIPTQEMDQNLNYARNLDYDTLITGTSMTENFRASWFNEKFGCDAIKLPFGGGHTYDFDLLFKNAFESDNQIKNVFFGLDIYTLTTEPGTTRFEFQDYQVNENPLYDVQYLLNKDITLENSISEFIYGKYYSTDYDELYVWDYAHTFSKKTALSTYTRPETSENAKPADYYSSNTESNLESIGKYIKNNPNTKFYIFFPPYSVLYWDSEIRTGLFDVDMQVLKQSSEYFLQFDNVELFAFITDMDVITDLDNYRDWTHYNSTINKEMVDWFYDGTYQLTVNNYENTLNTFSNNLKNYDYDSIFN